MFKNLGLRSKLNMGFGIPLLMMSALAIVCWLVAGQVQSDAELARSKSAVFAGVAQQMKLDVVQVQQWLSDISATRAEDGLDDGFDEAAKSKESFLQGVARFREMYREENNRDGLQQLDELAEAMENYFTEGTTMAKAYIEGGTSAGNAHMGTFDEVAAKMAAAIDPFVEEQITELDDRMGDIGSSCGRLVTIVLILSLFTIVVGVITSWTISRSIILPLSKTFPGLKNCSTLELNDTGDTLRRIAADLGAGSEQLSSASSQVSSASQSMAEGASEQASSLEETSASLEETSAMSKQNADNAGEANSLSNAAAEEAQRGNEAMERMMVAIGDIKKSSDETAKIIKVIDEIAFQTNLLALNAAVEAARAGEAGKGFAVVAEEVRNLAQRSAEAAGNTNNLIEGSQKHADNGVAVAQEVAASLASIVTSINKVTSLVGEISAASNEQAQGVDQINIAMSEMDKVTQQNASNAEETASASEELNAQALHQKDMVLQLNEMVGTGNSNGHQSYSKSPVVHAIGTTNRPAGMIGRKQPARFPAAAISHAPAPAKSVAPPSNGENLIPLEDEDFKDFEPVLRR